MNQSSSLSHSQTLTSFHSSNSPVANTAFQILRLHLRIHLLLLLLLLPSFYFFLSNPHHSFLLDFLYAISFSVALPLSLNLALYRLPSIRLLLRRSFPLNPASFPSFLPSFHSFKSSSSLANTAFRILRLLSLKLPCSSTSLSSAGRPFTSVLWSIGSWLKSELWGVSGSCVEVYSNGDVYEGEFHHGERSGSGIYYFYMSGRYEGDWVDNRFDGYGMETWVTGSSYWGQYRQGLMHGFGVCRSYTGSVYAGEWLKGQCHGLGHDHFRNGDTYAGEYSEDKMHGFGVYCLANGLRYEGAWHEGRMLGLGMFTLINGERVLGNWQNRVPDTLSTQNTDDGFPVAVNHSDVLDAVQKARRAAEKAFDVASVDERVNEAVAVANEAANKARVVAVKAVQKRTNNSNEDDTPIPIA